MQKSSHYKDVSVTAREAPPGADQPNDTGLVKIETGPRRFNNKIMFHNDLYWGVESFEVPGPGGNAAIRFFKLDALANVVQQSFITDPNRDLYYPSIAVSGSPNNETVVIGFTASSPSEFPSAYAVIGRPVVGGTGDIIFSTPFLLHAGTATYESLDKYGRNRWGDFSATVVDPVDPNIFWTIQEWAAGINPVPFAPSTFWSTQITQIILSGTPASEHYVELDPFGDATFHADLSDPTDTDTVVFAFSWGLPGLTQLSASEELGGPDLGLRLWNLDDGVLVDVDLDTAGNDPAITDTLDPWVLYSAEVFSQSGSGDYTVTIDGPDRGASTIYLNAAGDGGTSGAVDVDQDSDYFQVIAPSIASGNLEVTLIPDASLDGVVTLYDASGNQLARADGYWEGGVETISFSGVSRDQTYYLRVGSYQYASHDSYELAVDFELSLPDTLSEAEGFAYFHSDGVSHDTQTFSTYVGEANIETAGDIDTFYFSGDFFWSGTYTIDAKGSDGSFLDPLVGVYNADTGELLGYDKDSGSGTDARLNLTLLETERYIVAVADDDHSRTGDLELEITAPQSTVPTTIAIDADGSGIHTGESLGSLDSDYFRFTSPAAPSADVSITVEPTSGGLDVAAVLFDASGNEIAKAYLAGPSAPEVITLSGPSPSTDYYLTVLAKNYATQGSYDVFVNFTAMSGRITGAKFHDSDGDGVRDPGEVGLPGWSVYLDLNNNGVRDADDPLTQTDADGNYAFTDLVSGSYVVREQLQPGWIQTYPTDEVLYGVAPYTDEGMLLMIDPDTGGAYPVGSTGAEKLVGLASDGAGALYTIADSGLAQRAMHSVNPLTGELTRLFDLGVTGWGEGALTLTGDGKAAYAVRTFLESPPELYYMYNIMTMSPTVLDLGPLQYGGGTIASGTQVDGLTFRGDVLYGLIGGLSGGLSNHLVTIDTETREVTDVGSVGANLGTTAGLAYHPGRDRFYFAGAGSRWLYEVGPTVSSVYIMGATGVDWLSGLAFGTSRGTPLEGAHVVLAASDQDAMGVDFGNAQFVNLQGSKFHDLNGNGLNEGEPPLEGWVVSLDRNLNGRFDEPTRYADSPDLLKPLPDLCTSVSTVSVSGLPEVLRDVDVTLNITHTFVGDLEAVLVSPEGTRVPLFYRVGGAGDDFYGTILDDEASVPIDSGSAPFTGRFRPIEPLSAFDGQDPNGIWALEVTDHAAGDSGTLQFWFLTLSSAEPVRETGPDGRYEFRDLAPGGYSVRELNQPGWLQTAPSSVPAVLDDFEDNNMVEYTQIGAGSPAFTNPFAAHDGNYGAVAMTPMYRADPAATVQQGDVLSAWVRFANNPTGAANLLFGASATETLFVTLSADLQAIQLGHWQYAGGTVFSAYAGQRFEADTWYRVEVAWGTTGLIETRLYASDATTLLSTVIGRHTTITSGGVGLGSSGAGSVRQFDTITIWRDGARTAVLGSGEDAEGLDFGNTRPAWIEGFKWLDRDGNGQRDDGEPGMSNWTLFVDADHNAVRDEHTGVFAAAAVPAPIPDFATRLDYLTVSGLQGLVLDVNVTLNILHQHDQDLDVYLISPAGTRVELFTDVGGTDDHFTDTTLDDEAPISITAGTAPFSGSYRPEGLLSVFDGQDPNGLWRLEVTDDDPGVSGELMGWSITLTYGDPYAITGPGGLYEIAALPPGQYAVREEHQPGWLQTAPADGYYDHLNVLSGEPTMGVDFGNARPGSIRGSKYHDLDGNGQWGDNEPGLPGWEIFLDINGNGGPDHELVETVSLDTPVEIPDLQTVASEIAVTGLVALVLDVNVGLHITHPYDADLDVFLISPAGTRVELFTDVGGDGDNFFQTNLDDDAVEEITAAAAPFTGTFRPEGALADFLHEDPNGIWTLEVTDDAGGDVGRLEAWGLGLLVGDPMVLTDASGDYAFAELPPRDYVVREVLQEEWEQTAPPGGAHNVSLLAGQTVANRDFGNREANHPPVARDDTAGTDEDTPVNVDVLANDTDVENDPLWITILSSSPGTAVVNDGGTPADPSDDTVDYTPPQDFFGMAEIAYRVNDGELDSNVAVVTVEVTQAASVVARYVFYNNSHFDDEAEGRSDDDAIAPDKTALLPEGTEAERTARFANYTSYSRGINGIMIDVAELAAAPTGEDFEFRMGNDDEPAGWPAAATPEISVRLGAGTAGSDRITLIWPDNTIHKQWLQVTVLDSANTGLIEPDVFYFGNAIGECGNSATEAKVNAIDMLAARNNQRTFLDPAPINFDYDYNRDARVNAYDMLIARNNQTSFLDALDLITVPGSKALSGGVAAIEKASARDAVFEQAAGAESTSRQSLSARLAWLYQFEQIGTKKQPSEKGGPVANHVAPWMADYRP